jgi:hypothetical protein
MKKQPGKKFDLNELAASIVDRATNESEHVDTRNPHAVALGTLGGQKGGKARADKLSPEKRKEIAKIAAAARWKKTDN